MSHRFAVGPSTLMIELFGPDRWLALKGRLDIPLEKITAIRAMKQSDVPYTKSTWLRAPGGFWPGLFRHGSYGWKPNREFWVATGHADVVVIDIDDWDYHRVVISVPDPEGVVERLSSSLMPDA